MSARFINLRGHHHLFIHNFSYPTLHICLTTPNVFSLSPAIIFTCLAVSILNESNSRTWKSGKRPRSRKPSQLSLISLHFYYSLMRPDTDLWYNSKHINTVLGHFTDRHFADRNNADRHFADRHLADRTIRRKCYGQFADRHFGERYFVTDNPPTHIK